MELKELQEKTLQWSRDRGILANGKITTQALKLGSEVGELMDNTAKGNLEAMKDDIGDCLVVLTNLANLAGATLEECWEVAYNGIKDREGFLNSNGNFIKTTDENYDELLAKHESDASWEAVDADENAMIINYLSSNHLPGESHTHDIELFIATGKTLTVRVKLWPSKSLGNLPDNLSQAFLGKSVAQLKAFLSIIGDIV